MSLPSTRRIRNLTLKEKQRKRRLNNLDYENKIKIRKLTVSPPYQRAKQAEQRKQMSKHWDYLVKSQTEMLTIMPLIDCCVKPPAHRRCGLRR